MNKWLPRYSFSKNLLTFYLLLSGLLGAEESEENKKIPAVLKFNAQG